MLDEWRLEWTYTTIMANSYRKFLKLLEQWPVDSTKLGRDLGQHIREQVKVAFKAGEINVRDEAECSRIHASLKRLADNHYGQKHVRESKVASTGLSAEECGAILSNEFLEELKKSEEGFFSKIRPLSSSMFIVTRRSCNQSPDLQVENEKPLHIPVMVKEVLECFKPEPGQVFIDMTFGAGGHSQKLLESASDIKLFVLDRDPIAYSVAKQLAVKSPGQVEPLLGRFSELPSLLKSRGIKQNSIDGILFDFGCSSMQFDVAERGFSVSKDGPLDMRMDGFRFPEEPTAADVLAQVSEQDLVKILKVYGEEKQAKKIARAVMEARYTFRKLETTSELGDLVMSVCSKEHRLDKLQRPTHAATKMFQALRIFVNNEINELNYGMIIAERYLKVGGKLVTLTFHSLEDRVVKRHLLGNVIDNAVNPLPLKYTNQSLWYDKEEVDSLLYSNWKLLYKHVLTPSDEEVSLNPRSRSAKLRAAMKLEDRDQNSDISIEENVP